jgi:kinesin family member 13
MRKFKILLCFLKIDLLVVSKLESISNLFWNKFFFYRTLGVYVQDLSKHPVDSYEAIEAKMDEGYRNRSIGSTQMNATSSRAHTIITIEFKQVIFEDGRKTEKFSVINLVDLAGSEKAG